jgi:hypothetical protein
MFGKRNRPVQAEQPPRGAGDPGGGSTGGGSSGGTPPGENEFPWPRDQSWVACNLAAGNLANNLASWVEHEGRVHAETYVATSGAIAGYAAQATLKAKDPSAPLQTVTTSSGADYLFGDALNDMLFANTAVEAGGRVWPRAVAAAMKAGLSRIPNVDDMFQHVAKSLGGPLEGRPSTGADHQPLVPARQLLVLYWPGVMRLFSAAFDDVHRRFGPVPPASWQAVTAYAVSRPILDVKDVLDPAIALTILMESAIYASKLVLIAEKEWPSGVSSTSRVPAPTGFPI